MRNPLATLDAVRVSEGKLDPAINVEKSDLDAYRRTRDTDKLVMFDEPKPTVFKIKQPKAAFVMDNLARCTTDPARRMTAFQTCVHEIVLASGEVMKPASLTKAAYGMVTADDAWLDRVRDKFGMAIIFEMGQAAIDLGQISDEDAAGFYWPGG
jgi:hypothetical protein